LSNWLPSLPVRTSDRELGREGRARAERPEVGACEGGTPREREQKKNGHGKVETSGPSNGRMEKGGREGKPAL